MSNGTIRNAVAVALVAGAMLAGAEASAARYLVVSNGALPSNLAKQVKQAGGKIEKSYPFGVAVASSDNPKFAKSISGVQYVVEDVGFDVERPVMEAVGEDFGFPPNSGDDDFFFDLQWGHNYVGAQKAWADGVTGQGVRVAVLDGGFDLDHPDLVPNINFALSADFTGEGLQYQISDPFSHGTHVAGTIAAADNGFGTIGVAPDAELVLVKVLGDSGSGSFGDIIAGIYHAAMVDADVINMSLGAIIPRQGGAPGEYPGDARYISELANAVGKAITYATQMGTTVIVSAGNAGADLDGDGGLVRFNTGMPNAVGISALTPVNWAGDQAANETLIPASYTNYGTSMVEFSAPGGDLLYPGNEICTIGIVTNYCFVFDLVFSTGNGGWYWSGGTSMAAPHAAGIAALIISENGGSMSPKQVVAEMRRRGLDLGKPGADDFYGRGGQVNSGH